MKKFLLASAFCLLSGQSFAAVCSSGSLTSCPSPNYNSPNAYSVNIGGTLTINNSGVYVGTGVNVGSGSIAGGAITGSSLSAGSGAVTGGAGTLSSLNGATIGATTPEPGHFTTLYSSGAFTPTGGIVGSISGTAAAAGYVGEVLTNTGTSSIAAATLTNITGVTLTAGSWLCGGSVEYTTLSSAASLLEAFFSLSSGSQIASTSTNLAGSSAIFGGFTQVPTAFYLTSVGTSTSLYVGGYSTVSGSAVTAYISCLRVR